MRFSLLVAAALTSACLASPSAVMAAPVAVQVHGADGQPLVGAVVTIHVPGTAAPRPQGPYRMVQRDIAFMPQMLIVPVGAAVQFPNQDKVRHHVYSFSRAKRFDLKLYGRDETRSVTFDKPGAVALGCNIHDAMSGVVYVTDTPFAAATDASGQARFTVPATGRAVVTVWHPSIRAGGSQLSQPLAIPAAGTVTRVTIRR
ncbi:methylamine utilization protein [Sphingomonas sp.]|uniref:methylamine utilization protein n=1 Tax=Sphingomonas sp. TaxID=28214 RepID=UPI0035AFFB7E